MFLEKINLINFKNFASAEAEFCPKINCFVGDNGMGKTNMLDAIHFLSMCKSGLLMPDTQCVKHDEPFFVVEGIFSKHDLSDKIYCGFKPGSGKTLKKNGKEYDKISDHVGLYPLVQVSPADNNLVQESGEERRRFMNMVLSQLSNSYLVSLQRYNRLLAHRNKLLKDESFGRANYDVLEAIDCQIAEIGEGIFSKREKLIDDLLPVFHKYYAAISGEREEPSIRYVSHLHDGRMLDLLRSNYDRDRALQHTSIGIHRDDLDLMLGGYSAKKMGSQGQQKTLLVALKLAQFDLLKSKAGVNPILLLDDIFDKLDPMRVSNLIGLVASDDFGQIFITDSNKHRLDDALGKLLQTAFLFEVSNGAMSRKIL